MAAGTLGSVGRWRVCVGSNVALLGEQRSGPEHTAGDKARGQDRAAVSPGAVPSGDSHWRGLHCAQQTSFHAAWTLLPGEP